jgi:tight adherence protein B
METGHPMSQQLAVVPVPAVVFAVGVLVACASACVVLGLTEAGADRSPAPARRGAPWEGAGGGRVAAGVAVGFVALLATRWIVLAVAASLITIFWGRLLHDRSAEDERRRIEGIAKWLEDLRDTLRGSSVGAEEALEQVARRPPDAIRTPTSVFLLRLRQGFRTEDALIDLADALGHPTSDAAIAAIRLVVSGTAGAGRLYRTVDALAAAARDEVSARERIDRTRAVYRASMKRLIGIAVILIAYLRFAAGDLLAPYGTATGQVVLVLPLAMWAACVLWLRRMCRDQVPHSTRLRAPVLDTA